MWWLFAGEQRRRVALIASSDFFDYDWYLVHYPDVRAAGVDPAMHYLLFAATEGRNPSTLFDTSWYLATNPDVAAAGMNPLIHFLRHGIHEGRRPVPPAHSASGTASDGTSTAELKVRFRAKCRWKSSVNSLVPGLALYSLSPDSPNISIVMVLHNQAELTFASLRSLQHTLNVSSEVIIVNNASADQTDELLARIDGIRVVRNTENRHYIRGANQGAAIAKGKAILLLNNDVQLNNDSVSSALQALFAKPDVAAVGGKLALLDGTLQEAGSIILQDGSCLGYGRGRDPAEPEFQFQREVDYCSAAFLIELRRDVFERLHGFDRKIRSCLLRG